MLHVEIIIWLQLQLMDNYIHGVIKIMVNWVIHTIIMRNYYREKNTNIKKY